MRAMRARVGAPRKEQGAAGLSEMQKPVLEHSAEEGRREAKIVGGVSQVAFDPLAG